MMQPNLFVVISSGALVRITGSNDSYVYMSVLTDPPMHWSMPRAQYEAEFATTYRPATAADLLTSEADFDLPKNAPEGWRRRPERTAQALADNADLDRLLAVEADTSGRPSQRID